ncbi:MAG: 2-phosphosulfolactate phosphatase [Chitinophagales bacterium]
MPVVDVTFTPAELGKERLSDAVVVAIDVLRATTTAVTALSNGAAAVQAVAEPEEGRALLAALGEGAGLLGGERHGRPLPGFALGNSPAEYQPGRVRGKRIILTTTNGTRLLALCQEAREVVLAALVNAGAVARWLAGRPERVVVACAGRVGGFSLEDTVCAGLIVRRLGPGWQPTARAAAAVGLYGLYRDQLVRALGESPHGRYLADIGLGADLADCARVDRYALVPRRREGIFRAEHA